jgi:hypothetical protein
VKILQGLQFLQIILFFFLLWHSRIKHGRKHQRINLRVPMDNHPGVMRHHRMFHRVCCLASPQHLSLFIYGIVPFPLILECLVNVPYMVNHVDDLSRRNPSLFHLDDLRLENTLFRWLLASITGITILERYCWDYVAFTSLKEKIGRSRTIYLFSRLN